jgi:hypothetical protein
MEEPRPVVPVRTTSQMSRNLIHHLQHYGHEESHPNEGPDARKMENRALHHHNRQKQSYHVIPDDAVSSPGVTSADNDWIWMGSSIRSPKPGKSGCEKHEDPLITPSSDTPSDSMRKHQTSVSNNNRQQDQDKVHNNRRIGCCRMIESEKKRGSDSITSSTNLLSCSSSSTTSEEPSSPTHSSVSSASSVVSDSLSCSNSFPTPNSTLAKVNPDPVARENADSERGRKSCTSRNGSHVRRSYSSGSYLPSHDTSFEDEAGKEDQVGGHVARNKETGSTNGIRDWKQSRHEYSSSNNGSSNSNNSSRRNSIPTNAIPATITASGTTSVTTCSIKIQENMLSRAAIKETESPAGKVESNEAAAKKSMTAAATNEEDKPAVPAHRAASTAAAVVMRKKKEGEANKCNKELENHE